MNKSMRKSGVWPRRIRDRLWKMPCAVCGSAYKPVIDHIVSLASGGSNDESNLHTLCEPCNLRKGARRSIEEMHQWYADNKAAVDADRREREANKYNLDRF